MGLFRKILSFFTDDIERSMREKMADKAFDTLAGDIYDAGIRLREFTGENGISAETFMEMYDTRSYNFHNKQKDIKIMKTIDFEGVYVIHNLTKKKYFVGSGKQVMRKVDRHFRGYGNAFIYNDWKSGDRFKVRAIRLEHSEYDDSAKLAQSLRRKYNAYDYGRE